MPLRQLPDRRSRMGRVPHIEIHLLISITKFVSIRGLESSFCLEHLNEVTGLQAIEPILLEVEALVL